MREVVVSPLTFAGNKQNFKIKGKKMSLAYNKIYFLFQMPILKLIPILNLSRCFKLKNNICSNKKSYFDIKIIDDTLNKSILFHGTL